MVDFCHRAFREGKLTAFDIKIPKRVERQHIHKRIKDCYFQRYNQVILNTEIHVLELGGLSYKQEFELRSADFVH